MRFRFLAAIDYTPNCFGWSGFFHALSKPKPDDELRILQPYQQVQPGDIGIVNPGVRNHHFILTEVSGGTVSSMDGNAGLLLEIVRKNSQCSVSQVRASGGGFLTPIWENVLQSQAESAFAQT